MDALKRMVAYASDAAELLETRMYYGELDGASMSCPGSAQVGDWPQNASEGVWRAFRRRQPEYRT